MTIRTPRLAPIALVFALLAGCDDENPFRGIRPQIIVGASEIWELALPGFPSGFDFGDGVRFFVGTTPTGAFDGTFVLDARDDGTLVFRPFSLVAPGINRLSVRIHDAGAVPFESVDRAPSGPYTEPDDAEGIPVVEGHVYVFRIAQLGGNVVPVNFAKLEVLGVGRENPADPRSRFILFRWAYQEQPLNRNLAVPEDG